MGKLLWAVLLVILLGTMTVPVAAQSQTPRRFDVRSVTVGAQRTETLWAHALGKWWSTGDELVSGSAEIMCYKRFGFCVEASAWCQGLPEAVLSTFEILRWDASELIAVDSSPACVVNTLRFNFATKKVSVTSGLRDEANDLLCKGYKPMTAFLGGAKDETRKPQGKSGQGDK